MNARRTGPSAPVGAVLTLAAVPQVAARLEAFLPAQGWRVQRCGAGEWEIATGSRRRTVLLGALAGSHFHLHAHLALHEVPGALELHHRWGEAPGAALGGVLGRRRAVRRHRELTAALARHLDARQVRML